MNESIWCSADMFSAPGLFAVNPATGEADPCYADCVNSGDTALMMFATTFVMIQTPAMGLAQAGSIKRKNALSMLMQTLTGLVVGSVLWMVIGFSLTFGETQGGFIGWSSDFFMFYNIPTWSCLEAAPTIPSVLWATFQMMFALMVPVIVTGAWAEKMTFSACLIFFFAWPILVYYPLAHWVWGSGWLSDFIDGNGAVDFAGGITIHTASGIAALVTSIMMTRRKENQYLGHHNLPLTIVGGTLIWAGWYSFNGGSVFAGTAQAGAALINTHIAACTSGFTWVMLMYFRSKPRHWHLTEIMSGALAGLAGVTPSSGFVTPYGAFIIGVVVGVASWLGVRLFRERLRLDDVLDVMSLQGVPGMVGSILTAFFADPVVHSNDKTSWPVGLFYCSSSNGTCKMAGQLLGAQLLGVVMATVWSAFFTFLILLLIKYTVGIDVSHEVEEKGLDLTQIGEQGYDDTLDVLLDLGHDTAQTLVCEAAASGNVQELDRLIRSGAHAHEGDYDGRTPLILAAANGWFGAVKYLVETHYVNLNDKDKFGGTALSEALAGGHTRIAGYLKEKGASLDMKAAAAEMCEAAANGDIKKLKHLIASGVDVDCGDYDLRRPLHLAAASGHLEAVELLVESGAFVNAQDRWKNTPLEDARRYQHVAIIGVLEAAKAQGNNKKTKKKALLDLEEEAAEAEKVSAVASSVHEICAAAAAGDLKEVKRLIARKADAASADYDGRTPLHLAAANDHVEVLEYLLSLKGANVNAVDRWHQTPLSEALAKRAFKAVALLKANGAMSMNVQVAGRLCAAAAEGNVKALKEAADKGVDLNSADYDLRTPLHLAAAEGHIECVKLLVRSGVNLTPKDRYGNTPLDEARSQRHKDIIAILENPSNVDSVVTKKKKSKSKKKSSSEPTTEPAEIKLAMKLCAAAADGDVEELKKASQRGENMNVVDYDSRTALHLAASEGQIEVVKFLLSIGVDTEAKDRNGNTALDEARNQEHSDIVDLLESKGKKSKKSKKDSEDIELM